jgi:predicted esterase
MKPNTRRLAQTDSMQWVAIACAAALTACGGSSSSSLVGDPSSEDGAASSSGSSGGNESSGGSSGGSGSSSGSGGPNSPTSSGAGSSSGGSTSSGSGAPQDGGSKDGATGPATPGSGPTKLPSATGSCPTFTNGQAAMIGRMPVIMYIDPAAKSKPAPGGPLILYYHATGSNPSEVTRGFGQANITKVTSMGGVVAAFTTTACQGCTTTDDNVWFQEDGVIQDTVVACAIQQANIDTTHIHALGWSAGALHTMWVAFARSNYMASVISYSGGGSRAMPEDPTNKVPAILTYGDMGSDKVGIDFNTASNQYYTTYSPMGYYTMMCHHPGGHEVDPMVAPVSLQFFMAEPYKVSPQPYATMIPSAFPSYCGNMPK